MRLASPECSCKPGEGVGLASTGALEDNSRTFFNPRGSVATPQTAVPAISPCGAATSASVYKPPSGKRDPDITACDMARLFHVFTDGANHPTLNRSNHPKFRDELDKSNLGLFQTVIARILITATYLSQPAVLRTRAVMCVSLHLHLRRTVQKSSTCVPIEYAFVEPVSITARKRNPRKLHDALRDSHINVYRKLLSFSRETLRGIPGGKSCRQGYVQPRKRTSRQSRNHPQGSTTPKPRGFPSKYQTRGRPCRHWSPSHYAPVPAEPKNQDATYGNVNENPCRTELVDGRRCIDENGHMGLSPVSSEPLHAQQCE